MDSGTMVRAAGDEMGTVRVASTMSDGANTMIEHDDTLPSQLGTMVINTEDEEEEGTMKSKALIKYSNFSDRPYTFQRKQIHLVHTGSVLRHSSVAAARGTGAGGLWSEQGSGREKPRLWHQRQESISDEHGLTFEPEWPTPE